MSIFATKLRTLVSQDRMRHEEMSVNIDLTYITERVLGMLISLFIYKEKVAFSYHNSFLFLILLILILILINSLINQLIVVFSAMSFPATGNSSFVSNNLQMSNIFIAFFSLITLYLL